MQKAPTDTPPPGASWKTVCVALGILSVLFIVRVVLPWQASDSMSVYEGISQALIQQQNWGKQAVVGAAEYSPLPAIGLLLLAPLKAFGVARIVPVSHILVAFCQVWVLALIYLTLRIGIRRKMLAAGVAVILLALTALELNAVDTRASLAIDPFWVCAVPMAGVILYLMRWLASGGLRDMMFFALLSGVAAFCGPVGYMISLSLIIGVLTTCRKELAENNATTFLVAMPLIYATILHWLFNLLIMRDGLFAVRRLMAYITSSTGLNPSTVPTVAVLGIVALGAIIANVFLNGESAPRLACFYVLALLPALWMRERGHIFLGGEHLFVGLAGVILFASVIISREPSSGFTADRWFASTVCLLLAAGIPFIRMHARAYERFSNVERPSRDELINYVESRWQGSRFLVFGLRASILYCQSESKDLKVRDRFVGQLDLNMNVLKRKIQKEQLHILIPPDNGVFYPTGRGSFFSRIHKSEQPEWLFLEETWTSRGKTGNGWQLWRCIRRMDEKGSL